MSINSCPPTPQKWLQHYLTQKAQLLNDSVLDVLNILHPNQTLDRIPAFLKMAIIPPQRSTREERMVQGLRYSCRANSVNVCPFPFAGCISIRYGSAAYRRCSTCLVQEHDLYNPRPATNSQLSQCPISRAKKVRN